MTDILELVNETAEPKKFSLLEFARNRTSVTDSLNLYFDEDALYQLSKVDLDVLRNPEVEVPEKYKPYVERLMASRVILHLESLPPLEMEELRESYKAKADAEELTEDEADLQFFQDRIRLTIKESVNANGEVDTETMTREEVNEFFTLLPQSETDRLTETLVNMETAALLLSQSVGPDFLPRA